MLLGAQEKNEAWLSVIPKNGEQWYMVKDNGRHVIAPAHQVSQKSKFVLRNAWAICVARVIK
jgi:hypothetical protein